MKMVSQEGKQTRRKKHEWKECGCLRKFGRRMRMRMRMRMRSFNWEIEPRLKDGIRGEEDARWIAEATEHRVGWGGSDKAKG